ncbi:MAG: cadmium-translocating P-type ATPase [Ruminococcaceae bacterium]|jgi:Cd2+/Zn2+-exporting ATPase|nr:cadmium-translocating P-type ATPase [Oscillospiraceae bacterium]
MERTYLLKGLDCPNCAAKIEREAGRLTGVKDAVVNLMNQSLIVHTEAEADGGELLSKIEKIVHAHEPDVKVIEKTGARSQQADEDAHEHAHHHDHEHDHGHEHEHEHDHEHEHEHGHHHGEEEEEGSLSFRLGKLAAGGVLLLCGLLLPHFFDINPWIRFGIFAAAWLVAGYDVVWSAVRGILHGELFDECFLMTVSTVGAFAIGEYPEAAAVMLFYQLGELFQDVAVDRSRDSITALMDIRPDSAAVLRGGEWITVSPADVEIGETVLVKPGEKIPLDGVVRKGSSSVDTRALTGESAPAYWTEGSEALSGCVASDGILEIEVTKEAGESTASKILELCESAASNKAPAETFISKFARIYTPVVCALALLLAVVPPLILGHGWAEWIRRGCVVLAVSCPCALVISVPLTFFGGIGAASRRGVLVKGSAYLESLSSLRAVVFDKTGTLTKGSFSVTDVIPAEGVEHDELLELAARAESCSGHPIARSVLEAYEEIGELGEEDFSGAREIAGRGVSVPWNGQEILCGNAELMRERGIAFPASDERGTTVYVSLGGRYAGRLVIADTLKSDAAEAVSGLRSLGVKRIEMLTGDGEGAAKQAAEELNLDGFRSRLLPAGKVERLEELMAEGGGVAFVGDGINDAPVLARADVGIAMGGIGSDAAIEAADAVIMTDEPSRLCDAVKVSRKTCRIVKENIWFAIAVKAVFILLGGLGLCGMWAAVVGDVGVMILAVLNALRVNR